MKRLLWLALAAVLFSTPALPASAPLSGLSAGSAISGTDLFYDVQSVGTGGVKVTGTQLNTFVWGQGGATTSGSVATFNNSAIKMLGSSTGATTFTSANSGASNFTITFPAATGTVALTSGANVASVSNSDSTLTISPTTGAVVASLNLGNANTWTAAQTFTNSDIKLLGSSTGATTFTSGNASASNFTLTFPAATDQLVARATTDTLTNKTYDTAGTGNVFKINGTQITAISGNTGTVGTTTGALTSTHCVNIDASGNLKDSGSTCGGGGGSPGGSSGQIQYNNSSAFGGVPSYTDASTTFALGNSTTAQKLLVYNTVDTISGPTNYERGVFDWTTTANTLTIGTQAGGTGTGRDITLSAASGVVNVLGVNTETLNLGSGASSYTNIFMNGSSGVRLFQPGMAIASSGALSFSSGNLGNGVPSNLDTGISRDSAGVLDVGNGSQGDTSGTIKASHATLTTLANSATTSAVCYNTSTGVLTYDSTIGTCTTSTARVKHDIEAFTGDALASVMQMVPKTFFYNDEQHTPGQQLGFVAEDLAKIDPHLVSYDESGQPNAIRFLGPMAAYLTAAIQQQQREIEVLKWLGFFAYFFFVLFVQFPGLRRPQR